MGSNVSVTPILHLLRVTYLSALTAVERRSMSAVAAYAPSTGRLRMHGLASLEYRIWQSVKRLTAHPTRMMQKRGELHRLREQNVELERAT